LSASSTATHDEADPHEMLVKEKVAKGVAVDCHEEPLNSAAPVPATAMQSVADKQATSAGAAPDNVAGAPQVPS
jgi:hypothetical protein